MTTKEKIRRAIPVLIFWVVAGGIFIHHEMNSAKHKPVVPVVQAATEVAWDGDPKHPDCSESGHPDPDHPGIIISSLYTDDCPAPPLTDDEQKQKLLNSAAYLLDHYGSDALASCAAGADSYLRTIAKYDFAWDQMGFLENKFGEGYSVARGNGVLMVWTRKAKLQNGFGAYQHITLECEYDTQAKKVLDYAFHK